MAAAVILEVNAHPGEAKFGRPTWGDLTTDGARKWYLLRAAYLVTAYDQSVSEYGLAQGAGPRRLGALDLDLAPDLPGIYAWYAQLALSENDWQPRIHGDADLAAEDLTRAVSDYARVHHPEPLDLRCDGSYGLNWAGTIRRDSISDRTVGNEASRVEVQLGGFSSQPDSRRLLIELLRAAAPIFASPLYIGVATSLRVRLAEHKGDYESAKAALRNNPSASANLQFSGDSFGARIAGAGIQLEHLECWILPAMDIAALEHSGKEHTEAASRRSVAQTVEWILQRIFQPVLGRQ